MLKHREETHALYGIPADDRRASQWTNGQTIVDIVSNLFDATSSLLTEQTKDNHASGQKPDRTVLVLELQDQLKHLAEMTFWVFNERIAHLQRCVSWQSQPPEIGMGLIPCVQASRMTPETIGNFTVSGSASPMSESRSHSLLVRIPLWTPRFR